LRAADAAERLNAFRVALHCAAEQREWRCAAAAAGFTSENIDGDDRIDGTTGDGSVEAVWFEECKVERPVA
jgi:hypothetical protein